MKNCYRFIGIDCYQLSISSIADLPTLTVSATIQSSCRNVIEFWKGEHVGGGGGGGGGGLVSYGA